MSESDISKTSLSARRPQTVCIEVDTQMFGNYATELGLTSSLNNLVNHPTFRDVSVQAKIRALRHVAQMLKDLQQPR